MLQRASILSAPDLTRPSNLAVDASGVAMGGVLLQDQAENEHPVCYFSNWTQEKCVVFMFCYKLFTMAVPENFYSHRHPINYRFHTQNGGINTVPCGIKAYS